jgi:glucose-6-phosphate 1-epimerase
LFLFICSPSRHLPRLSVPRCQPSGDEVLFVRPDAVWDKSKPISGGIPLCFPQFGPGAMQQHGFARNVDWVVCSTSADPNPDDPEPSVMFKLKDNDYTREMWDVGFEATYEVTLRRDKLKVEFCVRNPPDAEAPIDFTAAVHTYVEVVDAASPECLVSGLKGKRYIDKAVDANNLAPEPCAGDVTFGTGLVDRVFQETEPEALLHVGTGAAVSVENTHGWTDTVVWNPHETLDKEGDVEEVRVRGERRDLEEGDTRAGEGVEGGDLTCAWWTCNS